MVKNVVVDDDDPSCEKQVKKKRGENERGCVGDLNQVDCRRLYANERWKQKKVTGIYNYHWREVARKRTRARERVRMLSVNGVTKHKVRWAEAHTHTAHLSFTQILSPCLRGCVCACMCVFGKPNLLETSC